MTEGRRGPWQVTLPLPLTFFSYLVEKGHLAELPQKDGSWAMPGSVFHQSGLPACITLLTFKLFFPSFTSADLHHLFLLLCHVRGVFVLLCISLL